MKGLILGGANGVLSDVDRALGLGEYDAVFTVNDVTVCWSGTIDYAVSLHAEKWPLWLEGRRRRGLPAPGQVVAHSLFKRSSLRQPEAITFYMDHLWPEQKDSGSSGLFAVKVALEEGFEKIVVCGCPMTPEARHFFDEKPWGGAYSHRRGWTQTLARLQGKVKSMSGWTAQQLGKPTKEWLDG